MTLEGQRQRLAHACNRRLHASRQEGESEAKARVDLQCGLYEPSALALHVHLICCMCDPLGRVRCDLVADRPAEGPTTKEMWPVMRCSIAA